MLTTNERDCFQYFLSGEKEYSRPIKKKREPEIEKNALPP